MPRGKRKKIDYNYLDLDKGYRVVAASESFNLEKLNEKKVYITEGYYSDLESLLQGYFKKLLKEPRQDRSLAESIRESSYIVRKTKAEIESLKLA